MPYAVLFGMSALFFSLSIGDSYYKFDSFFDRPPLRRRSAWLDCFYIKIGTLWINHRRYTPFFDTVGIQANWQNSMPRLSPTTGIGVYEGMTPEISRKKRAVNFFATPW